MSKHGLQVIENDALVVLCFKVLGPSMLDTITHHQFRQRAALMGFDLTKAQCHNMLNRAKGRIKYAGPPSHLWTLTSMGLEYRRHVLDVLHDVMAKSAKPVPIPGT